MVSLLDIIGPVMVGPSSSHTAGACRLGLIAHDLVAGTCLEVRRCGLATTGHLLDECVHSCFGDRLAVDDRNVLGVRGQRQSHSGRNGHTDEGPQAGEGGFHGNGSRRRVGRGGPERGGARVHGSPGARAWTASAWIPEDIKPPKAS